MMEFIRKMVHDLEQNMVLDVMSGNFEFLKIEKVEQDEKTGLAIDLSSDLFGVIKALSAFLCNFSRESQVPVDILLSVIKATCSYMDIEREDIKTDEKREKLKQIIDEIFKEKEQ